jgi:two-component system response regulator FlrC
MSNPTTILVVDDNPPMAKTLSDILTIKGYEVHTAYSGAEALEILKHHEIHILLTDVIMPDMDGVALYRQTRKTHPQLVTFLMTAYAADEIIQQGIAEGIKTVLTKPVDINLFLNLVMAVEQVYFNRR